MNTEADTLTQAWQHSERPLSASVAQLGEAVVARAADSATETTERLPLEQYPGVRDIDYAAGNVRLEDGEVISVSRLLGHHYMAQAVDSRA